VSLVLHALQVPVAIAAWRGLLEGRFRLLDRWCAFMSSHYKQLVVTEDTWTQVCACVFVQWARHAQVSCIEECTCLSSLHGCARTHILQQGAVPLHNGS
jgi:hypothetical protein